MADHAWCLGPQTRRICYSSIAAVDLFRDSDSVGAVDQRTQPQWKLALSLDGDLRMPCGTATAGMLIPPDHPPFIFTSPGHVILYVAPWQIVAGSRVGPSPLDRRTCRRILDALQYEPRADLESVHQEVKRLFDTNPRVDARLRYALDHLTEFDQIKDLAAGVRLSPVRLRALIHDAVGISLIRLRQWERLRTALAVLPQGLAVASEHAGFADQSHFTRTARRLLGRTPGSLLRASPGERGRKDAR